MTYVMSSTLYAHLGGNDEAVLWYVQNIFMCKWVEKIVVR